MWTDVALSLWLHLPRMTRPLPLTLSDWIGTKELNARRVWDSLEPFLEENGYTLFIGAYGTAPKDESSFRAPDPYHHWLPDLPDERLGPFTSIFDTHVSRHSRYGSSPDADSSSTS